MAIKRTDNSNLKMLYRTQVTGLSHHDYALYAQEIEVGTELEVEAVMGNGFDSEACAVRYNGEQIGWLSNAHEQRAAKGIIHRMLRNEIEIRAKVISHDRSIAALDKRLYIGLYIRVL